MPTRTDLLCKAKELGLKGYTAMSKDALEKFVEANMPKTVRVKRPKKKAVAPVETPPPELPVAAVKKIKVRKPKVVNPMAAVEDAKKYLEELEQKKITKGLGKLKKTVSKGIVKSALERAAIKYKLEKAMKNPIAFSEEESIPVKVKRKKKKPLAEQKKFKAGVAKVKETLAKGKAEGLLKKAIAKYKAKKEAKKAPSVAEQVMFNPDLLRKIGGYKKDIELFDELRIVKKVIFNVYEVLNISKSQLGNYYTTYKDEGDDFSNKVIMNRDKRANIRGLFDNRQTKMFKDMIDQFCSRIFYRTDDWEEGGNIDTGKLDATIDTLLSIAKSINRRLDGKKVGYDNVIYEEYVRPPYEADFSFNEDLDFIQDYFPKGSVAFDQEVEPDEDYRDDDDDYYDASEDPYTYQILMNID